MANPIVTITMENGDVIKAELHCLLSALLSPNLEADEKSETGSACTRQAGTCYEV